MSWSQDTLKDGDGRRYRPCLCGGRAYMDRYCGAYVCGCGNHVGLCRCFCGWSASGGDGYAELVEMGETIEPEDY